MPTVKCLANPLSMIMFQADSR
uniref:Calcineurin-binding protein cabin-1 n=1 Tax=Rhizophora mucronata TaxID=61149 RepID=A0A2P2KIB0_RHIMU